MPLSSSLWQQKKGKFDECGVKTVQKCGRNVMDKIPEKGDLMLFAVQIECCSSKEKKD